MVTAVDARNKLNIIHLTDFSFQKLCEKNYGVNRGIFNVVDSWFYHQGFINIIDRRKIILRFLLFIANNSDQSSKRKFGNGGLKIRLEEFWDLEKLNSGL